MALSEIWQEELHRQKTRLATDFMSRQMGVALTCGLFSFYLPPLIILPIYALILASEVTNRLLFGWLEQQPVYSVYSLLILNAWASLCVFSLLGALVWQVPEPLVKLSGVISLFGALINVSTARAEHLPLGIVCGIPPSATLLWMASRGWSDESGFGNSTFALIAVIGLIGYFGSALVQNHLTQSRLAQALLRSNAASRAKSRFLSEMNHEMRTPLNTILGLSQTLSDQSGPVGLSDRAREIQEAARSLQMLVEDVLDLAASEEGKLVHRPVTAVVRQELKAVARILGAPFSATAPQAGFDVAPDVPELGRFDPLLLRKCLLRAAGVLWASSDEARRQPLALTCRLSPDPDPALVVTMSASSDRPGTAAADRSALTGELVVRLAGAMNSRVSFTTGAENQPQVRLWLAYGPVPALPAPQPSASRRLRALIVDDLSTNRFVVSRLLAALEIDPTEAESGASALTALAGTGFDFVLLDMNMPAMSGEDTFRAIRSSVHSWARTPIIALTADAQAEQRERYLALGLDGYVAKPVDNRLLWAEIVACVPKASQAA